MLERWLLEPAARIAAAFVPAIMVLVLVGIAAGLLRIDPLLVLGHPWPLVGEAVTQNSVVDGQWHLYAAVVMLAIPALEARNGNVRVDFLYERLGRRARAWIDLLGHLVFAGPFLVLVMPAAWRFAAAAQRTAERSMDGGLADRFLVKGLLFAGLSIMALVILRDVWRTARRALGVAEGVPRP